MFEEEKEKPDWLSDLQKNQKHKERENVENRLDLTNTVLAYASPRYGRRSVPGTKSVDNSPTKSSSNENKSNSARSNSARPSLRTTDEFICKVKGTDSAFDKSLEGLRDDFGNLSLYNASQNGFHCQNVSSDRFIESWENSRNSFEGFRDTQEKESQFQEYAPSEKQNKVVRDKRNKEAVKGRAILRSKPYEGVKTQPGTDGTETRHNLQEFIIPELPQGQNLIINLKTTWGDKRFLGLNGIEIFNSKGIKPQIKSISGNFDNLNCTKGHKNIENLIDNIYLTQDDMHMWVVPYAPHSNYLICIEFDKIEELAMLRIWNYNKSRIHCYRGVKDVEIKLDDKFIFIGEIAMASGEILNTLSSFGDTILFTVDDDILELVAENDEYFNCDSFFNLEGGLSVGEMRPLIGGSGNVLRNPEQGFWENLFLERNSACTEKKFEQTSLKTLTECDKDGGEKYYEEKRVFKNSLKIEKVSNETKKSNQNLNMDLCFGDKSPRLSRDSEIASVKAKENKMMDNDSIFANTEFFDETGTLYIPSVCALASDSVYETHSMPSGYVFTIQIYSTWGDLYYVGLNGVQIFDENSVEIKLHPYNVCADPEGVNILDGMKNDGRTPDKLIDGVYDTIDDCHTWLAPVLPFTINRIELTFTRPVTVSSMKLWNYSKTPGRGVREFGILVDGLLIYNGELNQAVVVASDGLPRIPCKTINFSNSDGRKNKEDFINHRRTTVLVDQSNSNDQS